MNNKLVTVIIPVFNSSNTIRDCLNSILNQTYTNWEAICIDDGSTDNSVSIINEYIQIDNRFKLLEQENSKQAVARNNGIKHANGDFVAFLDSDDIALSYRLELQVSFLLNNMDISVLGGARININVENSEIKSTTFHQLHNKILKKDILYFCPFTTSTVMIRKEVFSKYLFTSNATPVEDYYLWLNMSKDDLINFANLERVLVYYRERKFIPWRSYIQLALFKSRYLYQQKEYQKVIFHICYILLSMIKNNPLNKK